MRNNTYKTLCKSKIILLLISSFLSKGASASEKIFNEIGTGLSEKGIYLDFIKNSDSKNTFGIRVNYLPEDFLTHQDIYIDDTNVKAEYFGIGMLYKYYLLPKESRSNFYLQANADISTFKIGHDIDLTKETYTQTIFNTLVALVEF